MPLVGQILKDVLSLQPLVRIRDISRLCRVGDRFHTLFYPVAPWRVEPDQGVSHLENVPADRVDTPDAS